MAATRTVQQQSDQYILGHAEDELDRLVDQARFFGDLTEHVLRLAGVGPGMRVLDLGCGTGDVSFLTARLVGPEGEVVGVDAAAEATGAASRRAAGAGLTNVHFVTEDLRTFTPDRPFDAVVGRLVLMYLPDPAAALRRLAGHLTPGGVVAFQEMDMGSFTSAPTCPLVETTGDRIRQTFARAGLDYRTGLSLGRTFVAAGLPVPTMLQMARVEGGEGSPLYPWMEQTVRTLLPLMERTGVASAAEVDVDTLASRLRQEVVANQAVVVPPPFIGAWTRTSA